jgi:hypothetical protein
MLLDISTPTGAPPPCCATTRGRPLDELYEIKGMGDAKKLGRPAASKATSKWERKRREKAKGMNIWQRLDLQPGTTGQNVELLARTRAQNMLAVGS